MGQEQSSLNPQRPPGGKDKKKDEKPKWEPPVQSRIGKKKKKGETNAAGKLPNGKQKINQLAGICLQIRERKMIRSKTEIDANMNKL